MARISMRRILLSAVIALGMTASSTVAMAHRNPDPGVLPLTAKAFGKTYAEWAAAWWQWALAIDGHVNPIEDPDGRFASMGQSGKVWFLAGTSITSLGQRVERHVTIPAGKAIFVALLNSLWFTIPYPYPGAPDGDPPFSVPGAEQIARDAIAMNPSGDILAMEIDGTPLTDLTSYRVQSTVFTAILPDYNYIDAVFEGGVALGIGGALLEEMAYDAAGQLRAASFMDYLLPTALEATRMVIDHLETPSPLNTLGVKGVGESGTLPVAAALASAVEDAIGRPVRRVPMSPTRLYSLMTAADSPAR